jgi:hypothetical protein
MEEPFHMVVSCWSQEPAEVVERLLKDGVDPNQIDGSGRTPLALCVCPTLGASKIRLKKAELLIKYGADVNQLDMRGWTVAHECAWVADMEMLQVLSKAGASFSIKNHDKSTPADLAFIKGHKAICSYLDQHTLSLKTLCRSVVRNTMGKLTYKHINELPVPPSVKLFVNYNVPYPGWECIPLPEEPWTREELESGKVNQGELKQFIDENADEDFKLDYGILSNNPVSSSSNSEVDTFTQLIEAYKNLFINESFKKFSYVEPVARKTRLGDKRFGVIDLADFERGAMDFLLNSVSD